MRVARRVLLVVAVTGMLAACHPRDHAQQTAQPGSSSSGAVWKTEGKHGNRGLRRICADDIAKYCQNEDRKKRCLKENIDKLSADCKAAVEASGERKRDKDNTDTDK